MRFLFKTLTEDFLKEHVQDFVAMSRRNITDEYWSEKQFLSSLNKKWELSLYVTNDRHVLLAFLIASKKESSVHIHKLVVDKNVQKKGIGGMMLNYLLNDVADPVTLKVDKQNDQAVSFYRKHGFAILNEKSNMYGMIWNPRQHG